MTDFITPKDLNGVVALLAAERTAMRKLKGEYDTEFIKRIVCAYLNVERELTIAATMVRAHAERTKDSHDG